MAALCTWCGLVDPDGFPLTRIRTGDVLCWSCHRTHLRENE